MTSVATTETTQQLITFAELVEYGRQRGARIVNGMPWSFEFNGVLVTHENDECYIIGVLSQHFTPRDTLAVGPVGMLVVLRDAAISAPAPEGRDGDDDSTCLACGSVEDDESEGCALCNGELDDPIVVNAFVKLHAALRQSAVLREAVGQYIEAPAPDHTRSYAALCEAYRASRAVAQEQTNHD